MEQQQKRRLPPPPQISNNCYHSIQYRVGYTNSVKAAYIYMTIIRPATYGEETKKSLASAACDRKLMHHCWMKLAKDYSDNNAHSCFDRRICKRGQIRNPPDHRVYCSVIMPRFYPILAPPGFKQKAYLRWERYFEDRLGIVIRKTSGFKVGAELNQMATQNSHGLLSFWVKAHSTNISPKKEKKLTSCPLPRQKMWIQNGSHAVLF